MNNTILQPWPGHEFFIETVDCSQYKDQIYKATRLYALAVRFGKIELALKIKKKYYLRDSFNDSLKAYGMAMYLSDQN